jgi:uncharacterized protein affecting Mg2+/Co2+ transport
MLSRVVLWGDVRLRGAQFWQILARAWTVVHGMNAVTTVAGSNDQNLWMVLGWVT